MFPAPRILPGAIKGFTGEQENKNNTRWRDRHAREGRSKEPIASGISRRGIRA